MWDNFKTKSWEGIVIVRQRSVFDYCFLFRPSRLWLFYVWGPLARNVCIISESRFVCLYSENGYSFANIQEVWQPRDVFMRIAHQRGVFRGRKNTVLIREHFELGGALQGDRRLWLNDWLVPLHLTFRNRTRKSGLVPSVRRLISGDETNYPLSPALRVIIRTSRGAWF